MMGALLLEVSSNHTVSLVLSVVTNEPYSASQAYKLGTTETLFLESKFAGVHECEKLA